MPGSYLNIYQTFPRASKFRADTKRGINLGAHRSMNWRPDNLMERMDNCLAIIERGRDHITPTVLALLYFAADNWMWNPFNKQEHQDQYRYVEGLFRLTVESLCKVFDIQNPMLLKEKLEEWWGRKYAKGLSVHGMESDYGTAEKPGTPNVLLADDELMKRRIVFKNGKAYMWDWYEGGAIQSYKLVKANSVKAKNRKVITPGHAGYVLRVDGQLFMARHSTADSKRGKFAHSAYTNGKPVLCAGEIAIVEGEVKRVTSSSGHYAPRVMDLMEMLRFLRVQQVNLQGVLVGFFVVDPDGTLGWRDYKYADFSNAGGNWTQIEQQASDEEQNAVFRQLPGYAEGAIKQAGWVMTEEDYWRMVLE